MIGVRLLNIKESTRIEKTLTITETDVVNGGEVLVLISYAVKENEELYSYPAPQIFNAELYEKNKGAYDKAVKQFRLECEEELNG